MISSLHFTISFVIEVKLRIFSGPSKSNGTGNSDHLSGKNLPRPLLMSGEVSVREKKSVDSDKKKDKVKKITNAKEAQEARDQMHWQEFVKRLKEDKAGKNIGTLNYLPLDTQFHTNCRLVQQTQLAQPGQFEKGKDKRKSSS